MRSERWVAFGVVISILVIGCKPLLAEEVLFCIGAPNGLTTDFGLGNESYAPYAERFPEPIQFRVGVSALTEWPFIHPAPRDAWAGGGVHTHSIIFDNPEAQTEMWYLHVGILDAHASERSRVIVGVNGEDLPEQRAPGGRTQLAHHPSMFGTPSTLTFPISAGLLKHGVNTITIRLEDESWLVYDYVALAKQEAPPAHALPSDEDLLEAFLNGPLNNIDEIVFAVRQRGKDSHWYANFGYFADSSDRLTYGNGGRLDILNVHTGALRSLINDPSGGVRDPQVHYDGETILFSYRPGGTAYYHLYTINKNGSELRQITDGPYDDIEPTYMPDGRIMFVSSRANRWVNCWLTQVAVLYRCNADGSNIEMISPNVEHDNTPWLLPDGRIMYTRWEYINRSQVDYHHLWTTNPDGTNQMVFYGNMHPGILMIDAKPVPDSPLVVASFSPGHGINEHDGVIMLVDPRLGPDEMRAARPVSRNAPVYRDPWAFNENSFMAVQGHHLMLFDDKGQEVILHSLPETDIQAKLELHEPRPIASRPEERIIADRVQPEKETGSMLLVDVYHGRNMEGVKPGEIKKLMVIESLPKPINYTGGMDPLTYGGSFTLERALGTVPVHPDGSAYFELPAKRPVFFLALDENDMSVKKMNSFTTVQPGEVMSCVGCHEDRLETPDLAAYPIPRAFQGPPSRIEPLPDYLPDVPDFPRDIQPILDRNCIGCHDYEQTALGGPYAGGILLTGDHGPMFSHSYFTMTVQELFKDNRNQPISNLPPRTIGSSVSSIFEYTDGAHYDVVLEATERAIMRHWIDHGAPYPGTYAALGGGSIGGYFQNTKNNVDFDWPTTRAGAEVMERRCLSCHTGHRVLPMALADEREISFWRFEITDPRMPLSRHIVFNLSRPEKSLLLMAPLHLDDGGLSLCHDDDGSVVGIFTSREDPDYKTLQAMIEAGREYLEKIKRFDMPGYQPPMPYIREMRRYGILPDDFHDDTPVNYYDLDRNYWRSFWYKTSAR